MNSLEFINQNIFDCKNHIKYLENKIIEDKKYPSLVKSHRERIEDLKPILQQLEQIKSELEAWYVLKPDLEHTENDLGEHEIELRVFYTDADVEQHDTKEKYYTLKKALEVENE